MRNKITIFCLLLIGTLYGQSCPIPEYKFRGGEGEEYTLNMTAIIHLGGSDCFASFGGHTICHSGMAFGMMPGMHKDQTQLRNNKLEFQRIDCSKYNFYYPKDSI